VSADAFSMFWLTILFFIVIPFILYWACCGLTSEGQNGAENPHKN
jgi:hypothetical protein